jgi:hypothetical protein
LYESFEECIIKSSLFSSNSNDTDELLSLRLGILKLIEPKVRLKFDPDELLSEFGNARLGE